MNTEAERGWREVVRLHVQAHWDDVRANIESVFSGAEARFINEYGTERVRLGHDMGAKALVDSLLPPPSEESYEVLEESAHRVLIQVRHPNCQPHKLQVPLSSIRFSLTQGEIGWQIDGIYEPCLSCNLHASEGEAPRNEPGKCFFCNGTGRGYSGKTAVRRFWLFRRRWLEEEPCNHCGGTGDCRECLGEAVPGWQNVFSIKRLGKPAGEA